MNVDIWAACGGGSGFTPIDGTLFRLVVEYQAALASNRLLASLDDQAVLETLLETSQPLRSTTTERLHYLLATPFLHPPLRHGSRFGRCHEPSLFYGALSIETVLAEAAYYRLVFWQGMTLPPKTPLTAQHILFSAFYACSQGIKLHQPPFNVWQDNLTDPCRYTVTQRLGSSMRQAGVAAFEYASARDAKGGLNVALFKPSALANPSPGLRQDWFSETAENQVNFYCYDDGSIHRFDLGTFLVNGVLPMPAV